MTDIVRVYEAMHDRMLKDDIPVHPDVLTGYLNHVREVKKFKPGLHDKVIIIARESSAEMLNLFCQDTVRENNVQLLVRG